jgi:hypothetical protein
MVYLKERTCRSRYDFSYPNHVWLTYSDVISSWILQIDVTQLISNSLAPLNARIPIKGSKKWIRLPPLLLENVCQAP